MDLLMSILPLLLTLIVFALGLVTGAACCKKKQDKVQYRHSPADVSAPVEEKKTVEADKKQEIKYDNKKAESIDFAVVNFKEMDSDKDLIYPDETNINEVKE